MEETLSNSRFIAYHKNQINPEAHPKSTLTFAYGEFKYGRLIIFILINTFLLTTTIEKMCREMASTDDVLKTKVLLEINEDFHSAEKINFALESTILKELVQCFKKKDDVIRELAARAVL